jgi:hypothetical protein
MRLMGTSRMLILKSKIYLERLKELSQDLKKIKLRIKKHTISTTHAETQLKNALNFWRTSEILELKFKRISILQMDL